MKALVSWRYNYGTPRCGSDQRSAIASTIMHQLQHTRSPPPSLVLQRAGTLEN